MTYSACTAYTLAMLRFDPFQPADMAAFSANAEQWHEQDVLEQSPDALAALAASHAFTARHGAKVLGCGGIMEWWPDRVCVWAIVGEDAGPHMRAITRMVRDVLDRYPAKRIEATVVCGFEAGHRWARLLGFYLEAERLRAYSPLGEDVAMYARIKP